MSSHKTLPPGLTLLRHSNFAHTKCVKQWTWEMSNHLCEKAKVHDEGDSSSFKESANAYCTRAMHLCQKASSTSFIPHNRRQYGDHPGNQVTLVGTKVQRWCRGDRKTRVTLTIGSFISCAVKATRHSRHRHKTRRGPSPAWYRPASHPAPKHPGFLLGKTGGKRMARVPGKHWMCTGGGPTSGKLFFFFVSANR